MHALDTVHLANALSGLAFLALGAWVVAARREPANVAFAAYAFAWCVGLLFGNLVVEVGHSTPLTRHAWAVLSLIVLGTLALLLSRHPTRLDARDRRALAVAVALAALVTAAWVATNGSGAGDRAFAVQGDVELAVFAAIGLMWGGWWGALAFLALRWGRLDGPARRSATLVSAALVLWPAFRAGDAMVLEPVAGAPLLLAMLVFAGLWLANAERGGGRPARNVAWLALATAVVAMVERTVSSGAGDLWGYGVTRVVGAAILAYAIVRHQILGIDVKVRWTISRSTVAAAFVAAFFVASEGAQIAFGQESEWVGLLAAGALVFAIAPLQRAAERLAERAVPVHGTPPAQAAPRVDGLAAYRLAVEAALRDDGRLTEREETHLADLAQALGVGAGDALRVRRDVEARARRTVEGRRAP